MSSGKVRDERVLMLDSIKEQVEKFDHLACFEKLKEFRNTYNIGQYICGVCIKACQPK